MATFPPTNPPQRIQRSARKLDRKKGKALYEAGTPIPVIAKAQGVASTTVWRFLASTDAERQAVKQYVSNRAEAFQTLQAKGLDLQNRIIDSFSNGLLDALKPHEKTNLLQSLNTVIGTIYDKERLETGKSTQNVGVIARMMGDAVKTAHENNELEKK